MSSSKPHDPSSASERRSIAARGRSLINRIAGGVRRQGQPSRDNDADVPENRRKEKRQLSQRTLDITGNAQQVKATRVDLDRVRQGVAPSKRQWSEQEDLMLREGVRKFGEKDHWREIAELVPGRNSLQCQQRWRKALKPGELKYVLDLPDDRYEASMFGQDIGDILRYLNVLLVLLCPSAP
jgi:hypothetical protein